MESLTQLKKQQQDKCNNLATECGMFFAFNNYQFEQNKTPKKDDEKYLSLGAGAFMPKSNFEKYQQGMKEISKWFKDTVEANKQREARILYELNNYECFYTGSIDEALEALGSGYTAEEVLAVYNSNLHKVVY